MKLDGQTLDVQCVSCSGEADLPVESVLTDVLVIFFLISLISGFSVWRVFSVFAGATQLKEGGHNPRETSLRL